MLELGQKRKDEPKASSLHALPSFGFSILEWLWPPGLVTAFPGVEVPQYGEGHREYGLRTCLLGWLSP